MGRKAVVIKEHKIDPDIVYNDILIARLINKVNRDGKKDIARKIVYTALDHVSKEFHIENNHDLVEFFSNLIDNVAPHVMLRSRKIGGATYAVPTPLSPKRRVAIALKLLVKFANKKPGIPMWKSLAREIIDSHNGQGTTIKKRDEIHKMAEANRAYVQRG